MEEDNSSVLYYLTLGVIQKKKNKEKQEQKHQQNNLKIKPNFFLATRINAQEIVSKVKEVQDHVQKMDCKLDSKSIIKTTKLHLTLFVLNIETTQVLHNVFECMKECGQLFKDYNLGETDTLKIRKIGSFDGDKVVWMGIEEDSTLQSIFQWTRDIKSCISNRFPEIYLEKKAFKPHITLFKLRGKKSKKISKESYEMYVNMKFGDQILQPFELLAMQEHDETGYYKCFARLNMDTDLQIVHDKIEDQQKPMNLNFYNLWLEKLPAKHNSIMYYIEMNNIPRK